MNQPFEELVTINILTYNRCKDLCCTLNRIYEQDYKNLEIIVIDNASLDNTFETVKSNFPEVKIIRLGKNIGIAGWNKGFSIAQGEYILVLDDDSYPLKSTISEGVKALKNEETVGIIAFNIFNTRTGRSETENYQKNPSVFVGCGALIKKSVFDEVGYFNELYFVYFHELDFSARCNNKSIKISYMNDISVIHNQSMDSRGEKGQDPFLSEYRFYHHFINYNIFLLQNFYWKYTVRYLLKWSINRFLVCLVNGFFRTYIKAVFITIKRSKSILRERNPLKKDVQKLYRNGNIPFIDRDYFSSFKKPKIKLSHKQ